MIKGSSAVTIDMPTMTESDWWALKNRPVGDVIGLLRNRKLK
jgi:hypothetical protein